MNVNLIKIDKCLDYVPGVSTMSNIVDLSLKSFYIPLLSREKINSSRFINHLENKSALRCVGLMFPVIGNAIHLYSRHKTISPADMVFQDRLKVWSNDPSTKGNIAKAIKLFNKVVNSNSLSLTMLHLNRLPNEIGLLTSLNHLYLWSNELTSLPSEIGLLSNLIGLYIHDNQIRSLPTEIGMLTNLSMLWCSQNKLTSLPTEIGLLTNLKNLVLASNPLTFLPTEIGLLTKLTQLDLFDNPNLRELPMSLAACTGLAFIDTRETAIPNAMRDTFLHQCRLSRDEQTINDFNHLARWQAYANSPTSFTIPLTDSQKITLNEWLYRLKMTNDFAKSQSHLAKTVWDILIDLKNPDFKELFFSQAEANNERCQDRAAMSLNEIYSSWLLLCKCPNLPDQEKLKILHGVAKTLRLRKTLQTLIQKHSTQERESVEIFLYYETHLKGVLDLETAIQNMSYETIGKRNWIDQQSLCRDVNNNFYEELIEIPLFAKMMEKQWEAINKQFQIKLEKLGDCPEGSDYDTPVLAWKASQGELMVEWRMRKIEMAKPK